MKKQLIVVVVLASMAIILLLARVSKNDNTQTSNPPNNTNNSSVNSYQECVAKGYPIQASYPTVCRAPNGQTFTNPDEKAPERPN